MRTTTLNNDELNDRCAMVFDLLGSDHIDDIQVVRLTNGSEETRLYIYNLDEDYDFVYCPDMSDRPQALAYLLGERDDFRD